MGEAARKDLDASAMGVRERYALLVQAVGPRPIAFVASTDNAGGVNLSPFSFYNAFGANPATIAFSPTLRGSDGTAKDTLRNVRATEQFTVSTVSWDMVEQMNLASAEYPREVDEFERAGFTKLPSLRVAPPGVAESPIVLECKLLQLVELGGGKASGNLVIGEVLTYRVREDVLDERGQPDPHKLDPVGRLGGNWYTRAREGLFELPKPTGQPIGFGALPAAILRSDVLTGSDLAKLASLQQQPDTGALREVALAQLGGLPEIKAHALVQGLIRSGKLDHAWAIAEALEARR